MVGNLSEVTQQVRDSGPVAQPPSRLPLSPSSAHMYFTQGRSKQTLCPLESGGWREAPSPPKKSEVPRSWAADSFLSRGARPSVIQCWCCRQRPQGHGICREVGCSAASQAGVTSTRVAQVNMGAGAPGQWAQLHMPVGE